MKRYAIGADIGGSHISCAVIDLKNEKIINETLATQKVDNKAPAETILSGWITALQASLSKIDKHQLAGIGFAMPGPFEYDKGIARFTHEVAKYETLYGINIAECVKTSLELGADSDVRFMNDASAFAVGEAWLGKGAAARRSVSITLGTGFGSAFIDEGVPVVERDDVPKMGCVWHLPFKDGIADDSFSTRWFIRRYAEKTGIQAAGVKEIADKAQTDAMVVDIFAEFGNNLGVFLGPWLKMFKTEALIIGGNVAGAYSLFDICLLDAFIEQNINTSIFVSELKEDAALIGSARMFDEKYWNKIKPLLSKM